MVINRFSVPPLSDCTKVFKFDKKFGYLMEELLVLRAIMKV